VRARLQPVIDLAAALAQAVLHVQLVRLVARERQVQAVELAAPERVLPFALVEEAAVEVLAAEEQPVAAGRTGLGAFLDKRRGNGATPVPGPTMMMSRAGSAGSRKRSLASMYTGAWSPSARAAR